MTRDILFDATRLLSRSERNAPTGIDRVCLAYAEWLLARPGARITPVRSGAGDRLTMIDPAWFAQEVPRLRARWAGNPGRGGATAEARLTRVLRAEHPTRSLIERVETPDDLAAARRGRAVRHFLRSRPLLETPPGQLYVNVGHTGLERGAVLSNLATRGVRSLVMVHDLIPITHPEFCRPGEGERHQRRALTVLRHAGQVVVNSRYTGAELTAFAERHGVAPPPIEAAHLGLEPVFLDPTATSKPPASPPYFVHVGTIEARKNLAFLLTLWRRLHETLGGAAPRLVLVGRYGWENEAVLDHLQRSPGLQGLVHQTSDLPDAALARLMRGAQAVLAPSSVEGFDLPAVEAMALGAPLIASDIPVHRELAPEARLIDPLDGLGWLEALAQATTRRPVAPPYSAPTWARHFATVAAFAGLDR